MSLLIRYRLQDGSTKRLVFDQDDAVVIGRDAGQANLSIDDGQLSRCHCRISRQNEQIVLEDLASSNGTWLNGERITAAVEVVDGDIVTVGGVQLLVEEVPIDEQDPLVGITLGDFEVLSVLGAGSCGVVYRALQTTLARPVAIKVLRSDWAHDPARRKAFLAEARKAGLLNHPNLIQVHDVLSVDDHYLMVMEYGQGGSADSVLAEEGPFALDDALKLMVDIARALAYAHGKGLVHRDVKPGNILSCGNDIYKLGDLGIAARMDREGDAKKRRLAGSPGYLAPEQACGMPLDGRADIYALGATIWHLLTGKTLYQGSAREVIRQQVEAPLPDLAALAPDVPAAIIDLLKRMMAKAAIKRIADAAEVADAAQALLDDLRPVAGSARLGAAGPAPRRRRLRRRRRSAARSAARSATRRVRRRRTRRRR